MKLFLALIFFLLSGQAAWAAALIDCHDGDTCNFRDSNKVVKVRLQSIDAPELNQTGGRPARRWLIRHLEGKDVTLRCSGRSWKRKTCAVFVGKKDIQLAMLRAGHAWVYPKYS